MSSPIGSQYKTVKEQNVKLHELCDRLETLVVRLEARELVKDSSEAKTDDWFKTYMERQEKITKDFEESEAKSKSPVEVVLEAINHGVNLGIMILLAIRIAQKIASSAFVTNLIQKSLFRV